MNLPIADLNGLLDLPLDIIYEIARHDQTEVIQVTQYKDPTAKSDILDLPNDIKCLICSYYHSLWTWLAIHDDAFYDFSRSNRKLVVSTLTHCIILDNNVQKWEVFGILHRENDLPAYIDRPNNVQKWYISGMLDRINDKPAVITEVVFNQQSIYPLDERGWIWDPVLNDYTLPWQRIELLSEWYHKGIRDRQTYDSKGNHLPAVICDSYKEWWQNGILYRNGNSRSIEFNPDVIRLTAKDKSDTIDRLMGRMSSNYSTDQVEFTYPVRHNADQIIFDTNDEYWYPINDIFRPISDEYKSYLSKLLEEESSDYI